jgi:hypothetical protein
LAIGCTPKTISSILCKRDWLEYRFTQEAIKTIYYLSNPKAEAWMVRHHNNQKWINTFPDIDMGFDSLRVEINDAIESSLEFINQKGDQ